MSHVDSKEKKTIVGLFISIVLLLLVVLVGSLMYIRASRPMRQAKSEAIALAKKHVSLDKVDQFYWFTREATYFSLVGQDEQGKEIVVVIPKSGEEMTVMNQNEGITEEKARAIVKGKHPEEEIKKVSLGMYQKQVAWEVMTKTSEETHYYLLAFSDGNLIKSIPEIE